VISVGTISGDVSWRAGILDNLHSTGSKIHCNILSESLNVSKLNITVITQSKARGLKKGKKGDSALF
jgi:hypothetical protein